MADQPSAQRKRRCCRWRRRQPERTSRLVWANDEAANEAQHFVDNRVTTSRYTWYNFVPVFLLQQFSRFANAYFLIVCILQAIPAISITAGVPTNAIPLAFVLFFDGVVTAREDYVRHRDDARANARTVLAMRGGAFVAVQWKDVRVGDVLKVMRGDEFPADLVFLAAGHEDVEQRGLCHVQTAQLDGETNLKLRQAPDALVPLFQTDAQCAGFRGKLQCEEPTEHFGRFNGVLYLSESDSRGVPIDANSTLLRGCVLRNVEHVYGLVCYTGNQTKVRVKQQTTTGKKAALEREINRNILALLVMELAVCIAGAVGYAIWNGANAAGAWYLSLPAANVGDTVIMAGTIFLLISNLIPISLYVSMKLSRTAQKFFIDNDAQCVYVDEEQLAKTGGESGIYPVRVRSMDLNDELGQISHIFTDKTGTLTSNYMEFRKLSIGGVAYGLGTTQIGMARRRHLGEDVTELQKLMDDNEKNQREVPHVNFIDGSESAPSRLLRGPQGDLTGAGAARDPAHAQAAHMMMLQLGLNHTVVMETVHDRATGKPIGTQLSASSPDEEAFVLAASYFGYQFLARSKDIVTLNVHGQQRRYRVVAILPYTQMRKMMSLVIEDLQAGEGDAAAAAAGGGGADRRFFLLCKGADSKIYSKLDDAIEGLSDEEVEKRTAAAEATKHQMEEWARDGLRTLCFAFRWLQPAQLESWLERYNDTLSNLEERKKKEAKLPNAIDDCMDELEAALVLQGATANEDKLQEEVPETIALCAEAGIKIYMLTGDKQETAVNIGYATRMLTNQFQQLLYTSEEYPEPHQVVAVIAAKARELRDMAAAKREPAAPLALVVDEGTMDVLLKSSKDTRADLLTVAEACRTVIACRCRPDQKKQMVHLIRANIKTARTLAIGDGANDVDMILEANVGVGIVGAEGVQAANASDYAIGRFRFLSRLLLVHGRWNYNRMALLVLYMFSKNVLYGWAQIVYLVFTAWSGQKYFLEVGSQTFNLVYTGLPVLIVAVLDKDVSAENALRFPYLYTDGLRRRRLNQRLLSTWLLSSVYEGILITVFTWLALGWASFHGTTPYVFEFGTYVFTAVVIVVNVRLAMWATTHSALFGVVMALCVLIWVPVTWVLDAADADNCRGCMQYLYGGANFWFLLGLITIAANFHVMVYTTFKRWLAPEYRDLVQEYEIALTAAGQRPSLYQRVLTWTMRRQTVSSRRTAKEEMDALRAQGLHVETPTAAGGAGGAASDRDRDLAPPLPPTMEPAAATRGAATGEDASVSAVEGAATVTLGDLRPVGPHLHEPHSLRNRWRHHPDVWTVPLKADVEAELREWPFRQRLLYSLRMMVAAGASPVEIENRRREMVFARLRQRLDEEAEAETARVIAAGEVRGAAQVVTTAAPPPGGAGAAAVLPGGVAPHRIEVRPRPPSAEAEAEAVPRRIAAAAAAVASPPALSPEAGATLRRKMQSVSRMHELLLTHRRTGTDFSVDPRAVEAYGSLMSSLGRAQSHSGGMSHSRTLTEGDAAAHLAATMEAAASAGRLGGVLEDVDESAASGSRRNSALGIGVAPVPFSAVSGGGRRDSGGAGFGVVGSTSRRDSGGPGRSRTDVPGGGSRRPASAGASAGMAGRYTSSGSTGPMMDADGAGGAAAGGAGASGGPSPVPALTPVSAQGVSRRSSNGNGAMRQLSPGGPTSGAR